MVAPPVKFAEICQVRQKAHCVFAPFLVVKSRPLCVHPVLQSRDPERQHSVGANRSGSRRCRFALSEVARGSRDRPPGHHTTLF